MLQQHRRHFHWSPFWEKSVKNHRKEILMDIAFTVALLAAFGVLGYFAREFAADVQANFFSK